MTALNPMAVWAVRRKGNGRVVTSPAANPHMARAFIASSAHPDRYEVVRADLIPTDWTPEEES